MIFSRVLATRLRQELPKLVISLQAGFVPRRNIDRVIDVFEAAELAEASLQEHLGLSYMLPKHGGLVSKLTVRVRVSVSPSASKCADGFFLDLRDQIFIPTRPSHHFSNATYGSCSI